jgi:hypothetical protein
LSAEALHVATGIRSASRSQDVRIGRRRHARDPRGGVEAGDVMTVPLAGQPGHGITASVRRQPARIVDDRPGGGYAGLFELICPSCGDHPYLDYTEVPPRLQWLRGPRALEAALAAYHKHIGASPRPDGTEPEA